MSARQLSDAPDSKPEASNLKRGRGKPRRAKGIAKKIMVRIDVETAEALRLEFGSLGNALFHTAEGLKALRAKGLSPLLPPKPKPVPPAPPPPATPKVSIYPENEAPELPEPLTETDWELIRSTIQRAADKAPRPHSNCKLGESDRLESALRKLEFALGRRSRGMSY